MTTTHYNVLGIERNASDIDVKIAYRSLSLKYHPDRNPGGEAKMHEINEAYEILSDSMKRKDYDHRIDMGAGDIHNKSSNQQRPGGFPFPFAFHTSGNGGGPQNGDINQMFEAMFSSGGMHGPFGNIHVNHHGAGHPNIRIFRNGQPVFMKQKPPVVENAIHISLENAYEGIQIMLDFERTIITNGVSTSEQEKIPMQIPQGIKDGEVFVLAEKGNVQEGIKGDVKIKVKIHEHKHFIRRQNDLLYKTRISLKDALCGFTVEIPHLNKKMLRISNQSNVETIYPGYQKIVEKLGMISGSEIGSLIIEFDIDFPKDITNEQREKLSTIL